MNENGQTRSILVQLRERAGLSQAELAERLKFTASRVSRLESGDTELSAEDVDLIASSIGSDEAQAYASYRKTNWKILERPGFNHVSLAALWKAEESLQRVAEMEKDPDLKNAFVQQIRSCRQALERAANALLSTDHPIALIGPPGVGKTTVICTLAELRNFERDEKLDKQMVLQTGGGRQTLCEVHVKNGGEFNISIDPCSPEEIHQYALEFCGDLLDELNPEKTNSREGPGLSAEADRAIRNMTGLTVKHPKGPDGKSLKDDAGKVIKDDQAFDLAKAFPDKDDLVIQVLTRMDLPRRNRTSISLPKESSHTGLEWVSKRFSEINYGRHSEFSLPRRIEITVPKRVLDTDEFDLALIDTRGVDELTAPRRDLQAYLDDPRAAIVLCSSFKDAPEAAVQAVIERAVQGGLKDELLHRGALLVLPGDDEECALRDQASGELVANAHEGREIRREQCGQTLHAFGFRDLEIHFADVRLPEDCEQLKMALVKKIKSMRLRQEQEIDFLTGTIERLISNRKTEETRAVFNEATKSLRNWFASTKGLPLANIKVQNELIGDMDKLRWASSLRASVNRRGNWDNFHYWHGLGFGTRRESVVRVSKQVEQLQVLIASVLRDQDLSLAHDFIRHFGKELEKAVGDYYQWTQVLGEGVFKGQLADDSEYWRKCQERWGMGKGYKIDVSRWTSAWFDTDDLKERKVYIELELQRQWRELLKRLDGLLSSADGEAAAQTLT